MKNYKENLYGAEQQKASYKRQAQPVTDVAGETKKAGSLSKSSKILNQLESTEDKKLKISQTWFILSPQSTIQILGLPVGL